MGTVLRSLKEIKPKYVGVWLKDQLSRSGWLRNLVVDRSAWGAFSIDAHARRSDGKSKIAYSSKANAEKAASDMSKRYESPFAVYKCLFCDGWHVSKTVKIDADSKKKEESALDYVYRKGYFKFRRIGCGKDSGNKDSRFGSSLWRLPRENAFRCKTALCMASVGGCRHSAGYRFESRLYLRCLQVSMRRIWHQLLSLSSSAWRQV